MIRLIYKSPHVSAHTLDDARLVEAHDTIAQVMLMWHDKTPPSEEHSDEVREFWSWLQLEDYHILSMRTYMLYLSMEHEFRFNRRLPTSSILDRLVSAGFKWPLPVNVLGRDSTTQQRALVDEWVEQTERDEPPVWTRRRPPEWLPTYLWHERLDRIAA